MPTEREYLESQIEEVEESLRLVDERKDEFVHHRAIPLDLIKDENRLRRRLEELNRRRDLLREETGREEHAAQQPTISVTERPWVDRDEERRLFRDMVSGQSDIHILLMEAEGGMGKTVLLEHFWEMSRRFQRARINLKDASHTIDRILRELCDQYGSGAFTMFHEVCIDLLRELGQDVRHPAMLWSALNLRLTGLEGEERRKYQQLITAAFLANLESLREGEQPVVMLFDNFQLASEPTKAWLAEQLICEIQHHPWLVCVITGRETPRVDTEEANWCLQQTLQPLSVEHRREYIQKVKITQNEELVTYITRLSKGNPHRLQELVDALVHPPLEE